MISCLVIINNPQNHIYPRKHIDGSVFRLTEKMEAERLLK